MKCDVSMYTAMLPNYTYAITNKITYALIVYYNKNNQFIVVINNITKILLFITASILVGETYIHRNK